MHFKNKTHGFQESNEFQRFTFKRTTAILHSFPHLLFKFQFHPLSFGHPPFRVSPAQVAFGTRHLWSGSQLPNSRIRVKMNQILSIILINTSNVYSFCPPPPSSHHHLTCANKASKWPVLCRTQRRCWKSLLCVVEPTQCLRIKRQEKGTAKSAVLIWRRMLGTSPLEETHCRCLN